MDVAEIAGGLAHELRNPLSTIMINLKLLAEGLQDPTTQPEDARRRALLKVEVLQREAQRLQNLFDDFLNLAGPCSLRLSLVDFRGVVSRLAEFLDPLLRASGIHLTVAQPTAPVIVEADEDLLRQALLNLAINARQAMPEGGDLRIALGLDAEEAFLNVTDTGVGIAEQDFERVLRPFFSTKSRGSGLGLSITHRIVQEHGGSLTFSSELGRGTTFTIRMPARGSEMAARSEGAADPRGPEPFPA